MNAPPDFDVFVSYNTLDHAAVERIARSLNDHGLTVFLDRWELVPGRPWPDALEENLGRCRCAALVLGPAGMGPWQHREHYLALDRQARDASFGVIPVILPNADPALGFLSLNTWVDLRGGVDDAESQELLAAAVRGERPSVLLERTRRAVSAVCPYRGLEVFREEDAQFFFGREAFVKNLCGAVADQSLVAVIGRSGSGKSSAVRAGLVPSLLRPDGDQLWEIATLLPGDRPLQALAGALLPLLEPEMSETDRLVEINKQAGHLAAGRLALDQVIDRVLEKQPGTDRLLLFVDQWEELYTQARDEEARRHVVRFIDELLGAAEAGPVTVVLTLRADFYGDALLHRRLADALPKAQVNLGPMTHEERGRAVTKPAEKMGLNFDTGLVDRLLDDVGDEPGNLPLMEFALKILWDARRGNQLPYHVYKDMGGVKGAVAKRAETLFARLEPAQQRTAEQVFTKLVRPGEETGDTRRRASLDELDDAEKALVRVLSGKEARLLVTGRDMLSGRETVEVAHEALIREWKRLVTWVDKVREERRDQFLMDDLAEQWREQGRPRLSGLASGRILRRFERAGAASELASEYLRASYTRRTLGRVSTVLSLVVLAAGLTVQIWLYREGLTFLHPIAAALDTLRLWAPQKPEMVLISADEGHSMYVELGSGGDFWLMREFHFPCPFLIGKNEVTFAEYDRFALATWRKLPDDLGWGRYKQPVVNISWDDAVAYAEWLSERTESGYRLPSEAEWEYAARGETSTKYWWGDDVKQDGKVWANCDGCGSQWDLTQPAPVGSFQENPFGLHDTTGNVSEWVMDCLHEDHRGVPAFEPSLGGRDCVRRHVRGGSWLSPRQYLMSAARNGLDPDVQSNYLGFRLAQDL